MSTPTGKATGYAHVGQGAFTYWPNADWLRRPTGHTWLEVAAVATDSSDRVFVFNRGEYPVMVFARDGTYLHSWGRGIFAGAHGITIGPDEAVYCADHLDHTVRKFSLGGRPLLTLGISGRPADTGATGLDFRTIRHAGLPFHYPTNVALSPTGEIYVADGYGNSCVHRFSPTGRLLSSWGTPGEAPGQFRVPHGIAVERDGRVFVADRENSRVQIFTPDGEFLEEWREIARPCEIALDATGHLFVAELGYRAGMWPGILPPAPDAPGGRISVFDPRGALVARWGGGDNPTAPGDFFAPHDICIDSHGDLYVAEVVMSAGGNRGLVSADCHTLQKFSRRRAPKEGDGPSRSRLETPVIPAKSIPPCKLPP